MPLPICEPSVRDHLLAEHAALRAALRALTVLSRRARRDAAQVAALRSAALDVADLLLAHVDHQEAVFQRAPAARDVWDEARRTRMRRDHAVQRALAANLGALLEDGTASGAAVARIVDGFATALLRDMDDEERGLLRASLADSHGG